MKIAVLAGSPKGEQSITLHYVKYLQKKLPEHEFEIVQIGKHIKKLEKDQAAFRALIKEIQAADGVVWCFPLYFLLVPSQLKRFIELVFERRAETVFEGKYATALTTSVYFYDHTAHNYIHGISEDLGMSYIRGYSAEMKDLLQPVKRDDLVAWFRGFLRAVESRAPVAEVFAPVTVKSPGYVPGNIVPAARTGSRKIVLLTDAGELDTNLRRMMDTFVQSLPNAVEVIDINQADLKGGCLGCCRCGADNICVYRDDMASIYRDKLMPADAVIYAGTIRDRYLSARWKMFMDRSFFNGHCPVLQGKQLAWIIAGPLCRLSNLRQVLEAMSVTGRMNLVGIVTDEHGNSENTTAILQDLGARLIRAVDEKTACQSSYLGVGGQKIFRDLIYEMRFFFKADYRFYKKNGLFDYPQKDVRNRLNNFFMQALSFNPKMRAGIYQQAAEHMLAPYREVLDKE